MPLAAPKRATMVRLCSRNFRMTAKRREAILAAFTAEFQCSGNRVAAYLAGVKRLQEMAPKIHREVAGALAVEVILAKRRASLLFGKDRALTDPGPVLKATSKH
jgi:hypothetical protein